MGEVASYPVGTFSWVDLGTTDVERAKAYCAARAQKLGGSVLLPPIVVPVGRFAIVADPAGASFSVTAVPAGPSPAWTAPDRGGGR